MNVTLYKIFLNFGKNNIVKRCIAFLDTRYKIKEMLRIFIIFIIFVNFVNIFIFSHGLKPKIFFPLLVRLSVFIFSDFDFALL